jgi:hypothetical protein
MSVHLFVPRCSESAWSSAVAETELGDFRFVPLDTAQAMAHEALAIGVPLIGRIAPCRRGEARCYSIRAAAGGERLGLLELERNGKGAWKPRRLKATAAAVDDDLALRLAASSLAIQYAKCDAQGQEAPIGTASPA